MLTPVLGSVTVSTKEVGSGDSSSNSFYKRDPYCSLRGYDARYDGLKNNFNTFSFKIHGEIGFTVSSRANFI